MFPEENLPPIIDIPIDWDAAFRLLQLGRQIVVGGFSLYQWGFAFFSLVLGVSIVRYMFHGIFHVLGIGVPDALDLPTDELDFGDDAGDVLGSEDSRASAGNDLYGENLW